MGSTHAFEELEKVSKKVFSHKTSRREHATLNVFKRRIRLYEST